MVSISGISSIYMSVHVENLERLVYIWVLELLFPLTIYVCIVFLLSANTPGGWGVEQELLTFYVRS